MTKAQIIIPTGYEIDQKKAEAKRAIAKLMMEKTLQTTPMQSWLQVLGQVGAAAAGKRLEHKADGMDADTNSRILKDYTQQLSDFHTDEKLLSSADLVAKYQGKPFLEDALKPHVEAMTARLKDKGHMVNDHGTWLDEGGIKPGQLSPNDPTAAVIRDASGNFVENDVRRSAALHAQGYDMGGAGASMSDPRAPNGVNAPVSGAATPQLAPPGGPLSSGADSLDLGLLSPDERGIMARELQRRAGGGGGFTPPNPNVPMGSPLTAQRAPAGVAGGKPYWIINGVPYDNPEGK